MDALRCSRGKQRHDSQHVGGLNPPSWRSVPVLSGGPLRDEEEGQEAEEGEKKDEEEEEEDKEEVVGEEGEGRCNWPN